MGIFSFFVERRIIKKVTRLLILQKQTFRRFASCKERENWSGAAADIRMMLEAVSYIDHILTRQYQKNGFKTNYDSKFGRFSLAATDSTEALKQDIAKALLKSPPLKEEFIAQMANETSQWKTRMVFAMAELNEELISIGGDIDKAAVGA